MNKKNIDFPTILLLFGGVILLVALIVGAYRIEIKKPIEHVYVYIGIVIFSMVVIITGFIWGIVNDFKREFKNYCKWCSNCNFNLDKVNKIYKRCQNRIYYGDNRGAVIKKSQKACKYKTLKKLIKKEMEKVKKEKKAKELSLCFNIIESDCDHLNDIYKSILFPGLLAIVGSFYEGKPFETIGAGYVDSASVIILSVALIFYIIMQITNNERSKELILEIKKVIDNNNNQS